MVRKADLPKHVVATAMTLAAEKGWRRISLGEIAAAAGLSLAELYAVFPSKGSILRALAVQADETMLAAAAAETDVAEESPRDRLFLVLMARFDTLQPYKDGIASVLQDAVAQPLATCLCGGPPLLRSMRWALEAAGISSAGCIGLLRVKALAAIYVSLLPVWLRDDSADMARTMAALDRRLARAEALAERCRGPRPSGEEAPPPSPPPARPRRRRTGGRGRAKPAPA